MPDNNIDPWIELIPESTLEKTANPAATNIGRGLGGIASFIANPFIKLGIISENNIKQFEEKLLEKNNKIPDENKDYSKQGLALKALEDSVYQLDNELLQEYFTNLISATLDNRKNQTIYPSFSSILKDLSPIDANLFSYIYKQASVVICGVRVENKETRNGASMVENIIITKDSQINQQTSIDTLQRFGLINVEQEKILIAHKYTELYNLFEQSDTYNNYLKHLPYEKDSLTLDHARILKGSIKITELGKVFGSVVISD